MALDEIMRIVAEAYGLRPYQIQGTWRGKASKARNMLIYIIRQKSREVKAGERLKMRNELLERLGIALPTFFKNANLAEAEINEDDKVRALYLQIVSQLKE